MKTTQTQIMLAFLLTTSLTPTLAFAQGARGGGLGVKNADGSISLVDTLEGEANSVHCDWSKTMADLLRESPEAQAALQKLEKIHAYVPIALRAEAERIQVCMGREFNHAFARKVQNEANPQFQEEESLLARLNELQSRYSLMERILFNPRHVTPREFDDWSGSASYEDLESLRSEITSVENQLQAIGEARVFKRINKNMVTIAYRWGQKVIMDRKKVAALSKVDLAFLYIHEISHSFLEIDPFLSGGHRDARDSDPAPIAFQADDEKVFNRTNRLWGFVHAIYQNYKYGTSKEAFSRAIVMNGASLPESDTFWLKSPLDYVTALTRNTKGATNVKSRVLAISKLDWRDVQENLVRADKIELNTFITTWYTPAIQIMRDPRFNWEADLKGQIETYGLDPFQALPDGRSLLTIAAEEHNQVAVNLLLTYPMQSKDRAVRGRFFTSILKRDVVIENPATILANFDPNEGEYIRVVENGIQRYVGGMTFFAIAIKEGNFEIARLFLGSGKVSTKTIADGFRVLMSTDMGQSQKHLSTAQEDRRAFMNELAAVSGFTPSRGDLLAALKAENEYATDRLLDVVVPYAPELIAFVKSKWGKDFMHRPLLEKIVLKAGDAINSKDSEGFTVLEYAVSELNLEVARVILRTNRVRPESISQGIRSVVALDMGDNIKPVNSVQQNRRGLLKEMLAAQGVKPSRDDLLAALQAKNSYASALLVQTVTPQLPELLMMVNSEWGNRYEQRDLLTKMIQNAGSSSVNAADQNGNTMIDYAITSRDGTRFDLLITSGATVFKPTTIATDDSRAMDAEKDWIMSRLIGNDAGVAITAYLEVVEQPAGLWIQSKLQEAKNRGKTNAIQAIEAFIKGDKQ